MTIEEVNQEVTYGPTTGPSGRSDISAVRQVGGLAVARWRSMRWRSTRWKPMRRLMRIWCCGWDCNLLRRYKLQYIQNCMRVH